MYCDRPKILKLEKFLPEGVLVKNSPVSESLSIIVKKKLRIMLPQNKKRLSSSKLNVQVLIKEKSVLFHPISQWLTRMNLSSRPMMEVLHSKLMCLR